MKKKSGFTLIELLAVIALLAILGTIATTSAINISKNLKKDMLCEKIEFIESEAKNYGSDVIDTLTEEGIVVTVSELVEKGYIKKDQNVAGSYVLNPYDDTAMDGVTVKIYRKNNRAYAHVNYDASFCEE